MQSGRQTDRKVGMGTGRVRRLEKRQKMGRQTDRQTEGQTLRETDRGQKGGVGDRQGRQVGRKTESRHTGRIIGKSTDRKSWLGTCRLGRLEERLKNGGMSTDSQIDVGMGTGRVCRLEERQKMEACRKTVR